MLEKKNVENVFLLVRMRKIQLSVVKMEMHADVKLYRHLQQSV